MNKKLLAVITLLLIPMASAVQTEQIASYDAESEINTFQSENESHFLATDAGTTNFFFIQKLSENQNWTRKYFGDSIPQSDLSDDLFVTASTSSTARVFAFNYDGATELVKRSPLAAWSRDVSIYEKENETLVSYSSDNRVWDNRYLQLYNLAGEKKFQDRNSYRVPHTKDRLMNETTDSEKEILIEGRGDGYGEQIELRDLDGDLIWENYLGGDGLESIYVNKEGIIAWTDSKLYRIDPETGRTMWDENVNMEETDPVEVHETLIYSNSSHLVYRDMLGKVVEKKEVDRKVEALTGFPERDLLVGIQGENLSIFNYQGEKLYSERKGDLLQEFQFADYRETPGKDLAYVTNDQINVLGINYSQEEKIIEDPENYAYIGTGEEMLEIIAMNHTAFIGEDPEDFRSETDKDIIEVGESIFKDSITSPNRQLNFSSEKYYLDDRKKAVYLSAIASKNEKAITFEKSEADYDYSNKSLEEIQKEFIELFQPNHISVADLSSETGLLSGYMGVKQGIMPLHFGEEYSFPSSNDPNISKVNRQNNVPELETKIEERFDKISENENTVFDGRYISIIDAPRKIHQDPEPENRFLGSVDGKFFSSDTEYGNLNDDMYLQAGVGRYPDDIEMASKLYHRSLDRQKKGEALIGSTYRLNNRWPSVLLSLGGGARHGMVGEIILNEELEVTHLVEHRSDPIELMMSLTPGEIISFMNKVEKISDIAEELTTEKIANLLKYARIILEIANHSEEAVMIFFEYRFTTVGFDLNAGIEEVKELEIPRDETPQDAAKRSAIEIIYATFWPDKKPQLNRSSLEKEMSGKDFIYYQGEGDRTAWYLPDYNNSNKYQREFNRSHVPELQNPLVWDSSDLAGERLADMREKFLEQGASSYIGFSSENLHGFSSTVANTFLKEGETAGSSSVKGVNSVRTLAEAGTRSTTNRYKKTGKAFVYYGNPEMEVYGEETHINHSRSCEKDSCLLNFSHETDYTEQNVGNDTLISFDNSKSMKSGNGTESEYYSYEFDIDGSSVENIDISSEYTNRSDIVGYSEFNSSENETQEHPFPENSSWYHVGEDKLRLFQAAAITYEENTAVLEDIQLEVEYSPEASVNLEKEQNTVYAEIFSDREMDIKLIYSFNGNRSSRDINLEQGNNRFRVGELPKGRSEVEVYITDSKVISKDSERFVNREEYALELQAPETIEKETQATVTAKVSNPNRFKLEEKIYLETDRNSRLDLLEKPYRKITVPANSTKSVSFDIVGSSVGKTEIKVNNETKTVNIEKRLANQRILSLNRFQTVFNNINRYFDYSVKESREKLNLKTEKGSLKIINQFNNSYRELETEDFVIIKNSTPEHSEQYAEDGDSYLMLYNKNGVEIEKGDMTKEKFSNYKEILDREIEKFELIYE